MCKEEDRKPLTQKALTETTTIGVRWNRLNRTTLTRKAITLPCPSGDVAAKEVILPDGSTRITPEYDACKALADEKGCPLADIYNEAVSVAQGLLRPPAAR